MADKSKSSPWPDVKLPELPAGDAFTITVTVQVHAENIQSAIALVATRLTAARSEPQRPSSDPSWLTIHEITGTEDRP
jgi:hypothetical protein